MLTIVFVIQHCSQARKLSSGEKVFLNYCERTFEHSVCCSFRKSSKVRKCSDWGESSAASNSSASKSISFMQMPTSSANLDGGLIMQILLFLLQQQNKFMTEQLHAECEHSESLLNAANVREREHYKRVLKKWSDS